MATITAKGQQIILKTFVRDPANRWQRFKLRHFPAWAQRLWPVRWIEREVEKPLPFTPFHISAKLQACEYAGFLDDWLNGVSQGLEAKIVADIINGTGDGEPVGILTIEQPERSVGAE